MEYIEESEQTRRHSVREHNDMPVYHIDGNKVTIMGEEVSILDPDGKLTNRSKNVLYKN